MHASVRPKIYTVSLMTKVRQEMADAVMEAARADGMTQGEWVRNVIHDRLAKAANARIVLAEVISLRTVLLTLQKPEWRDRDFTNEQLVRMVEAADARRFALADGRISSGAGQ